MLSNFFGIVSLVDGTDAREDHRARSDGGPRSDGGTHADGGGRSGRDAAVASDAESDRAGDAPPADADLTDADVEELLFEERVSKVDVTLRTGLTPAEFVLRVIEYGDGSMNQQDLVETLGWSASSVSRLLCRMEADDAIERVRIGRKKRIYHPAFVPDARGSRAVSAE